MDFLAVYSEAGMIGVVGAMFVFMVYSMNKRGNEQAESLQDLKTHIKNNTKWSFDGSSDARSYNVYKTYKDYGVANPVFNNGETYPKRSTHMTAYCFLNKSDINQTYEQLKEYIFHWLYLNDKYNIKHYLKMKYHYN